MDPPIHLHLGVIPDQSETGPEGRDSTPPTPQAAPHGQYTVPNASYQSQSQTGTSNEPSASSVMASPEHLQAVNLSQGETELELWASLALPTPQAAPYEQHAMQHTSYQSQVGAARPKTTQPSSGTEQQFPSLRDLGPLGTMDAGQDSGMNTSDFNNGNGLVICPEGIAIVDSLVQGSSSEARASTASGVELPAPHLQEENSTTGHTPSSSAQYSTSSPLVVSNLAVNRSISPENNCNQHFDLGGVSLQQYILGDEFANENPSSENITTYAELDALAPQHHSLDNHWDMISFAAAPESRSSMSSDLQFLLQPTIVSTDHVMMDHSGGDGATLQQDWCPGTDVVDPAQHYQPSTGINEAQHADVVDPAQHYQPSTGINGAQHAHVVDPAQHCQPSTGINGAQHAALMDPAQHCQPGTGIDGAQHADVVNPAQYFQPSTEINGAQHSAVVDRAQHCQPSSEINATQHASLVDPAQHCQPSTGINGAQHADVVDPAQHCQPSTGINGAQHDAQVDPAQHCLPSSEINGAQHADVVGPARHCQPSTGINGAQHADVVDLAQHCQPGTSTGRRGGCVSGKWLSEYQRPVKASSSSAKAPRPTRGIIREIDKDQYKKMNAANNVASKKSRAKKKQKIEEMERTNVRLTATNDFLTTANENLTTTNGSLAAANENLTAINANLTAINANLTAINANLTANNENLTARIENLTAANENLTAVKENLTAAKENLTANNENMQEHVQMPPEQD